MSETYKSLGATESVRQRRYDILTLLAKLKTPTEIAEKLDIPRKTVYNDMETMDKLGTGNIPLSILRKRQESAFEMKIKELEDRADRPDMTDNAYNATQRLILDNRMASLKLMGLTSDKVELTGKLAVTPLSSDPDILKAANELALKIAKPKKV